MNQLSKYAEFRAELALAETYEEIRAVELKADLLAQLAQKEKVAKDMQNEWGRFRVEIKAKKGAWLEEKFPKGAKKGTNNREIVNSSRSSLQNVGISFDESSNSRLIHENPDLVDLAIDMIIEDGDLVTPNLVSTRVRETLKEIQPNNSVFNAQNNDNIEWSKWSWNPITGCKHGCKYCYARDIANRFYEHKFEPHFYPERLYAPQNTVIPKGKENVPGIKNVFVCSMSDIMGEWVNAEWVEAIIDVMNQNKQWNYLLLTKNPKRYLEFEWPDHVWLGATADTQKRATEAVKVFQKITHSIKFLSCEPLEESIILPNNPSINWIIIGGRSESTGMPAGQPKWAWVETLFGQARMNEIKIYCKPNLKVLPKEYPL